MRLKIPGKLNSPPSQAEFDNIPIQHFCKKVRGTFYRLHGTDPASGTAWDPIYFSRRGTTRFDPAAGVGTMCIARSLGGSLMEIFDDRWGAVGDPGRSLTNTEITAWWVTEINAPTLTVFDATGPYLSKIGTDAQVLSGDYDAARQWALRLMLHPHQVDGILYSSRHDPKRENLALFQRDKFAPSVLDVKLCSGRRTGWKRDASQRNKLVYGPATQLNLHAEFHASLCELEVALLP